MPTALAMRLNFGRASPSSGDSLRLPRAETNGAITLQLRSQKATTLSPFTFLCPLKPMFSPPFFAAVVVGSGSVGAVFLMNPKPGAGNHLPAILAIQKTGL